MARKTQDRAAALDQPTALHEERDSLEPIIAEGQRVKRAKIDLLSLDRDSSVAEHPVHTRAKYAKFLEEDGGYYAKSYKTYESWLADWHGASIPEPQDHFTTRQIAAIAEMVMKELRAKGYDRVDGGWSFRMNDYGYELHVRARDSWQDSLAYGTSVHQDFECSFRQLDEVWTKLRAVPGRDRRELEVLLRQTNSLGEVAKNIRGQAAKAFARELIALGEKHQNLLTKD